VARETAGYRLVVTAPTGDTEACRRALLGWARRRAVEELPPRLEDLATLHGFRYDKVTIRHQRTRWGSCSPRGTISLNLRLLLLEPELIDHVLLHELCHTREPDHSEHFWALLRALDEDCAVHRRQARESWRSLPRWLRHEGDAGGS
jgi:predicted metal-dependent hydrolase